MALNIVRRNRFLKPIIAILLFIFMQVITGGIMRLLGATDIQSFNNHTLALSLSLMVSGLITMIVLYRMNMFHIRVLDPRRINWSQAHLGIVGAIVGIFATTLFAELINLPDTMRTEFLGLAYSKWGILAIAIVGPITEEVVFRAGILGYLIRRGIGQWTAIVLSSLAFGLIHFNPAQIPYAIIIGIILGVIYVKSRSIILTSFIHIFNNAVAVLEIRKFGDTIDDFSLTDVLGHQLSLLYIFICSVLCYVFLREYIKKYHRRRIGKKRRHHHSH